jgi:hypothetical protein
VLDPVVLPSLVASVVSADPVLVLVLLPSAAVVADVDVLVVVGPAPVIVAWLVDVPVLSLLLSVWASAGSAPHATHAPHAPHRRANAMIVDELVRDTWAPYHELAIGAPSRRRVDAASHYDGCTWPGSM